MAITLFYVYFAVSSFWSAYPSDSFIRVVKDFGSTLVVASVILSEKNPSAAVRAVYTRSACVLFPLSAVLMKYSSMGRTYTVNGDVEYIGVATQKNSLGTMVMVLTLFLVWDHLETRAAGAKRPWSGMRWDFMVLMVLGVYLLYMSGSQTSLVCLLLGLALMLGSGSLTSPGISRMVFIIALCLPALLFFAQEFNSAITPLLGALGRDATFTGRTDIWKHITWTTINPLVGAGFNNFWGGKGGQAISEALQSNVPSAHNGYLDIYLDGGLIGLVLLFCLLFASGSRLIRELHTNRFQTLKFAFLIVVMIGNFTESYFARPSIMWFTTLLVLVEFPFPKARDIPDHQPQESSNGTRIVDVGA
jgi:O-antigen ligase